MRSIEILVCASLAAACSTTGASAGSVRTTLSLQDIDCQSCGAKVVQLLEKRAAVVRATFDVQKAEITVSHDASESPDGLRSAVEKAGYRVVVGASKGYYQKAVRFDAKADVQWISRQGEDVDLEQHRASGKVTVFDFYATWCGPCRQIDREMVRLLARHQDLALRKINLVDWDTPVTKRYLKNVPTLPYVIVYGRRGRRVATITGLKLDALRKAIAMGRTQ